MKNKLLIPVLFLCAGCCGWCALADPPVLVSEPNPDWLSSLELVQEMSPKNPQQSLQKNPFSPLQSLQKSQESSSAQLIDVVMDLQHADAKHCLEIIKDRLDKFEQMSVDIRTNRLILRIFSTHANALQTLIRRLDIPSKQVLIKARIVNVDVSQLQDFGIDYQTRFAAKQDSGHFTPISTPSNGLTIPLLRLPNDAWLDMKLQSLEQRGYAKIMASPQLLTINQESALIESGEEVPYQERTGVGNTSVAFKKAVLRLRVTPKIMPNHEIFLALEVNQDKISALAVNGIPAIRTQHLQTEARVHNRQTLVLGGIFEDLQQQQHRGLMGLQKIPFFGWLFKQRDSRKEHRELLIFVTPVETD